MKYKKIFLISLSLIYSTNVFSDTSNASDNLNLVIPPEHEAPLSEYSFIKNPLFDTIISDSYVQTSRYDKYTYQIKLDKTIAEDLAKYLKNKKIQDLPEYILNNIVYEDRHIEINTGNKESKDEIINYFNSLFIKKGDKNLSLNRDSVIDIMRKNEKIIITTTEKPGIDLKKINNKKELYTQIDAVEAKNSSFFILDENTNEKIDRAVKTLEQDDYLIKNIIKNHEQRTNEDIEEHQKKINNNKNKIEQNEKDIITNASDIVKNKIDIQERSKNIEENRNNIIANSDNIEKNEYKITVNNNEIIENKNNIEENRNRITNNTSRIENIKENYIDNLNINGNNISLKNHFATLYTEQSVSRTEIKTLKNNFEHFKSDTENRFYKVEKRANQGIASVAAMSNLPFTDNATFSTAIGIGNYRNATALAWGMQYRINENVKVRASTAWNDSNSFVSAGGVGISW